VLVVVPAWRANAGAAEAIAPLAGAVDRLGAIVVDGATFEGAASASLPERDVDALLVELGAAGIEAFRVRSGEDLSTCLSRTPIASR
jgi:hypothetical protein